MASARHSFAGSLPIAGLGRLCEMLADNSGEVDFTLDFGRDEHQVGYVDVRANTTVQVMCQRSLRPFALPMAVSTRLGMIQDEREEAALPPDYEPLLIPSDGLVSPSDLVEEELLLAMPLVAIDPDSRLEPAMARFVADPEPAEVKESPFAVLRGLKG